MSPRLRVAQQERYTHVPLADRERARIVPVRWWLPGTSATTLGRWIMIRRDRLDDSALIGHELVHVRQWRELGTAGFLRRYLSDYLAGRRRGLDHDEAYRGISLEVEARLQSGY